MADVTTIPNLTWTTTNVTVANLNQYVRDQLDSYFQGVKGDASVDTDMVHQHKVGTLAARPAATTGVGRLYYASNLAGHTSFISNGTTWEHQSGPGVADSFDRANVEPMNAADSGHTWTENEGDIDIVAAAAQAVTLVGSRAHMTLETGGLVRTLNGQALIVTGGTPASINVGLVLKRTATEILYVHLTSAGLRLVQGTTQLALSAYAPTAASSYIMEVSMIGSQLTAKLFEGSNFRVALSHGSKTDIQDYAPTATQVGVLFGTASHDSISSFGMKFN